MQSFCGQELLMEQCRVVTWRSSVCVCFQLRPLRRRFPHRVSAESTAVSPLRSERAAPQEAVVLLVTRWRQPRLLPPALPEHLRTVRAPPRRLLDRKPRLQVRAFHAAVALWRPEPPQLPRQAMQTERMSSSHVHAQIWNRTLRLVSFSFFYVTGKQNIWAIWHLVYKKHKICCLFVSKWSTGIFFVYTTNN